MSLDRWRLVKIQPGLFSNKDNIEVPMERRRGRQCQRFICDLSSRKEPPISRSIAPEVFERSNKSSWDISAHIYQDISCHCRQCLKYQIQDQKPTASVKKVKIQSHIG